MPLFRKKETIVEAVQWNPPLAAPPPQWFQEAYLADRDLVPFKAHDGRKNLWIRSLDGDKTCRPGDWVIRDEKGRLYGIDDDIFRDTYELVAGEAA